MTDPEKPAHSPPSPVHPPAPPPAGAGGNALLDAATLERVRARDREALGMLYDGYFDDVFGLACALLGDRTLAEDATADVFLKVHRSAHLLDATRDPRPWLLTIATNTCRDLWRSGAWRMRRASSDLDDPLAAAQLTSGRNDPEQDTLVAEGERLVRRALASLPGPLREAIVLHDWLGLPHDQVATVTGIGHAAARKRYSRALSELGRRLKGML